MHIYHRLRSFITPRRLLLAAGLLVCAGAGWWLLRTTGTAFTPASIRSMLAQFGGWGPLVLIISLTALLIVPLIPATLLQIGAGLAFGPPLGLVYVLLADVLGATCGFWLARRWGKALLERWLSPTSQATLARLARRMTWRTVMLLRLLPGPAYPLVSFAAGYSPLSFGRYLAASFAGVLPSLALLVLAGDLVTESPLLAFAIVIILVGSLAVIGKLVGGGSDPVQPAAETADGQQEQGL